jgi:hypothetical protein
LESAEISWNTLRPATGTAATDSGTKCLIGTESSQLV